MYLFVSLQPLSFPPLISPVLLSSFIVMSGYEYVTAYLFYLSSVLTNYTTLFSTVLSVYFEERG